MYDGPVRPRSIQLLFVATLALPLFFGGCGPRTPPPNVIVILVDDLGYGDLGVHGSDEVLTPNIDAFFAGGVRFTNAYVNQPTCAPSRAGLLTGRNPHRYGFVNGTGPPQLMEKEDRGLPIDERLLPTPLRRVGYRTAAIGKWHLGMNEKYLPTRRGFDEFFGHLGGGHEYFDWNGELGGPILRNEEPAQGDGYLTEAFADEAIAFVERNSDRPFFLYLAFNAVHSPFEVPEHYTEPFAHVEDDYRRTLLGMLYALDIAIGRVMDSVQALGLDENTLVFFVNDNGGADRVSSNAPLTGDKWDLHEGGIRVPFAMRWPGHITAGTVFDGNTSAMDVFTTTLSAAGARADSEREIDGVDLLPYLAGTKTGHPHEILYWHMKHQRALRHGDLKLYETGPLAAPVKRELYDLSVDISESNNLANDRPEDAQRLHEEWVERRSRMVQPLF